MKKCLLLFGALILVLALQNCSDNDDDLRPISDDDKGLAARWADVTLYTIQYSYPNSPTYTSRSLGYIGLTMYESVVHGSPLHKSVAGELNGLGVLPQPEAGKEYNWSLTLNAGQALILKSLYPHASSDVAAVIDSLESATFDSEMSITAIETANRSVSYGRGVAEAIYEWSKTDGGHEGFLRNFDPDYEFPTGNGYWIAPVVGQSASPLPLHPYWGTNRTFISSNASLPVPEIIPFSIVPTSEHYKLFQEVHSRRNSLTEEERRIAAWWADDPTQTASPPGHSYNLATIAVTSSASDIFTASEAYAKVGMAVADAFVCCWKCKYTYHSERPFPFIKKFIDQNYMQFWPEPPFPAFSSGHATQSAAAATVLVSIFGENFPLVDNTYENRISDFEGIQYRSRTFTNIQATATECAHSRFLGGIHTKQDNETGAAQGNAIGENFAGLSWRK